MGDHSSSRFFGAAFAVALRRGRLRVGAVAARLVLVAGALHVARDLEAVARILVLAAGPPVAAAALLAGRADRASDPCPWAARPAACRLRRCATSRRRRDGGAAGGRCRGRSSRVRSFHSGRGPRGRSFHAGFGAAIFRFGARPARPSLPRGFRAARSSGRFGARSSGLRRDVLPWIRRRSFHSGFGPRTITSSPASGRAPSDVGRRRRRGRFHSRLRAAILPLGLGAAIAPRRAGAISARGLARPISPLGFGPRRPSSLAWGRARPGVAARSSGRGSRGRSLRAGFRAAILPVGFGPRDVRAWRRDRRPRLARPVSPLRACGPRSSHAGSGPRGRSSRRFGPRRVRAPVPVAPRRLALAAPGLARQAVRQADDLRRRPLAPLAASRPRSCRSGSGPRNPVDGPRRLLRISRRTRTLLPFRLGSLSLPLRAWSPGIARTPVPSVADPGIAIARARASSSEPQSRPRANHIMTASRMLGLDLAGSVGSNSSRVAARKEVGWSPKMIVQ